VAPAQGAFDEPGRGWILFAGIMLMLAGVSWEPYRCSRPARSGPATGRWFGIAVAGLSSIGALMSLPAYPFWSLAIFAVDILVIYGLAAYGGQDRAL
jgi:hypothetical protein